MRVWRFAALAALFVSTFAAPGLAQTKPTPIIPKSLDKKSLSFPLDRTFAAVSYKDQKFKDDRPTLLVSSSYRGLGFSACNNWSATIVPRADQRIAIGPVAITKRSCDKRLMHNEQVFLFVMRTSQTWFFDGKVLTLTGPYGTMTFEPAA